MAMELSSSPAPPLCPSPSRSSPHSFSPKLSFRHKHSPSRPISCSASSRLSIPALAISIFSTASGTASAVSYDDIADPLSLPSAAAAAAADLDVSSAVDSVSSFVSENPLAIVAGAAVIGLPLLVSSLFSQPKPWGSVSAKDAFKKLEDPQLGDTQLLDIRSSDDVKAEGTPDLRQFKKRVFQIPYTGEDEAYLKTLLSRFKDPSSTTLFILDQFDGNAISLAKYVTKFGFKSAYAIKDGAEGPNGWRKNQLPWLLPRKGFQLDITSLKDVLDSTFIDNPNLVPATLGVAAAAGVSLVVLSEAETALQLLGSAALIQLFVKKFLFAKDRQRTLKELTTFLDTKIAPKELVDEIKGIGGALLPKYSDISSDSTNGAVVSEDPATVTPPPEPFVGETVSAPAEPVAANVEQEAVDSVDTKPEEPVPEISSSSNGLSSSSRPLSPYTQFPGLKPPSSPTPSRP